MNIRLTLPTDGYWYINRNFKIIIIFTWQTAENIVQY